MCTEKRCKYIQFLTAYQFLGSTFGSKIWLVERDLVGLHVLYYWTHLLLCGVRVTYLLV